MSDDLVERLHDRRVCSPAQNSCRNDHVLNTAADRIEDLEANLEKAEGLLVDAMVQLESGKIKTRRNRAYLIGQFLAELKGETDE